MRRVYLQYVIILYFVLSACNNNRNFALLNKLGINSIAWKNDSLGCLSYRYRRIDSIIKYENELLKINKVDFLSFFGEPNLKRKLDDESEIFFYISQPSLYCEGKVLKEQLLKSGASTLHFIFNNQGKMVSLGMKNE